MHVIELSNVARKESLTDCIVSALFDALLCSPNNLEDMRALLKEMHRVLKYGGVYVIISHGGPDSRIGHIKRHIDVEIEVIPIRKINFFSCLYC